MSDLIATTQVKRSIVEAVAIASGRPLLGGEAAEPRMVCYLLDDAASEEFLAHVHVVSSVYGVDFETIHDWLDYRCRGAGEAAEAFTERMIPGHPPLDETVFIADPPELIPENMRALFEAAGVTLKLAGPETVPIKVTITYEPITPRATLKFSALEPMPPNPVPLKAVA
jgi:hypothetical protein